MIIPRVYAENFWANLDKYVDEKYIIDDGKQHFVRNRKTTQESIMKYPLYFLVRISVFVSLFFFSLLRWRII